jgi:hypothetical protein
MVNARERVRPIAHYVTQVIDRFYVHVGKVREDGV